MKRLVVVYNPSSGKKGASKNDIDQALKANDLKPDFVKIGKRFEKAVKAFTDQGAELIVAAGGDGTVNAVAEIAIKYDKPMAVLPTGTLNHFAKDIGLPINLEVAAAAIADGKVKQLDYGTVNDHVFVNNSSIGIYPQTVIEREKLSSQIGKWPAAFWASLSAVTRVSTTHLEINVDNKRQVFKTPLVFVGNNSYEFEKVGFTNRQSLTGGSLFLYVVRANRARTLLSLSVLAFFGKRLNHRDFLATTKTDLVIKSRKKVLDVAVDGEVISLKPPLTYQIHPKGLAVCIDPKALVT